jgi:hypothetical protein
VEQVAVGVAVVGVDVGPEDAVPADPLELAEERRHVAYVAQRGRRLEQRADRAEAEGRDPLGVHEGVVEVGDLAGVLGVGRVRGDGRPVGDPVGELGDDVAHLLLADVGQLHERAPARPVGRDLRLLQPAAVHVAEEVVLRPDVGVHALTGVVEDAHEDRAYGVRRGAFDP